jgi:hypothetical protein
VLYHLCGVCFRLWHGVRLGVEPKHLANSELQENGDSTSSETSLPVRFRPYQPPTRSSDLRIRATIRSRNVKGGAEVLRNFALYTAKRRIDGRKSHAMQSVYMQSRYCLYSSLTSSYSFLFLVKVRQTRLSTPSTSTSYPPPSSAPPSLRRDRCPLPSP